MLRKFWLDVLFGTIFIFAVIGLFGSIVAFKVFDVFDPIGDAMADMETTDIVFSQMRDRPDADEDVVLVNIGNMPRAGIAELIRIVNNYNPKVIGLDTFFYNPRDSIGDLMLRDMLSYVPNLVMASKLHFNEETEELDSIATSMPAFSKDAHLGFANLITAAASQDDLKVCRSFTPKQIVNGEEQLALAVQLAMQFDPEKAQKFLDRNNEVEYVNYRGNVLDYGATEYGSRYFALDVEQVFNEDFVPELIEGKLIIFCYLGEYLGDRRATEDKYFTPLNANYAGKAELDMFGGVIHANIISMIMNEDYIDAMSPTMAWFWAVVAGIFNVALFSLIYKRIPRWYDGTTKLFQLLELGVLLFLILLIFDTYNYKMDLTYALIVIAISGDALEVYYGVVKNTFTREGRRELFKINKL
ncbi:MAG: CHASE2 domain-containing protein [Cyclobacteriaceae bacterium]